VWKPLRGPLRDWPLAICDHSTLSRDDLIQVDEVHRDGILESNSVQYNTSQKCYYLSDQTADEVLIFRSADSSMHGEGTIHEASVIPLIHSSEHWLTGN
jgi:hypothetical protein